MQTMEAIRIEPTHTCFDDTKTIMFFLHKNGADMTKLKIVHAKTFGGKQVHAWVEYGGESWEMGLVGSKTTIIKEDSKTHAKSYEVTDCYKYTLMEILKLCDSVGDSTGPWRQDLRELCRDYEPSMRV